MGKTGTILANRLRLLRRFYGMSQKEVADQLHLERSSYTYYETGQAEPSLHTLDKLALMYDVSIDFLLGRKTDQSTEQILTELFREELFSEDEFNA